MRVFVALPSHSSRRRGREGNFVRWLAFSIAAGAARWCRVRLPVDKSIIRYFAEIGSSYYCEDVAQGVRISVRAGGNHAKARLLDSIADDGAANATNRSLRLNFELNVLDHVLMPASHRIRISNHDFRTTLRLYWRSFSTSAPQGHRGRCPPPAPIIASHPV